VTFKITIERDGAPHCEGDVDAYIFLGALRGRGPGGRDELGVGAHWTDGRTIRPDEQVNFWISWAAILATELKGSRDGRIIEAFLRAYDASFFGNPHQHKPRGRR